jgi:predicted transcriptional regulator
MTTMTIELKPETYARIAKQAKEQGRTPVELTQELVENSVETETATPAKTARELLEEAGMLRPLGDELKSMIGDSPPSLDEVIEILSNAGGPSLGEILDQQRGPKG